VPTKNKVLKANPIRGYQLRDGDIVIRKLHNAVGSAETDGILVLFIRETCDEHGDVNQPVELGVQEFVCVPAKKYEQEAADSNMFVPALEDLVYILKQEMNDHLDKHNPNSHAVVPVVVTAKQLSQIEDLLGTSL